MNTKIVELKDDREVLKDYLVKIKSNGECIIHTIDGFQYLLMPAGEDRYSLKLQGKQGVHRELILNLISLMNFKITNKKVEANVDALLYNVYMYSEVKYILNQYFDRDIDVIIKYNRGSGDYSYMHPLSYRIFVGNIIDTLEKKGFIKNSRGYYDNVSKKGRISWFQPLKPLLDLLQFKGKYKVVRAKKDLIILRDHLKREIKFNDTEQLKKYRYILSRLISVNAEYEFVLHLMAPSVISQIYRRLIKGESLICKIGIGESLSIFTSNMGFEDQEKMKLSSSKPLYHLPSLYPSPSQYSSPIPIISPTPLPLSLPVTCNVFNQSQNICQNLKNNMQWRHFDLKNLLDPFMIFNSDFEHGGRIYSYAQNIDSILRPFITIDGEPVICEDFSGMHFKMLYARKNIMYKGDPYEVRLEGWKNKGLLREVMKVVSNILINSKTEIIAIKAINKEIREGEIIIEKGFRANHLIKAFKEKHPLLEEYICSGEGLRLQNEDKDLAIHVIDRFTDAHRPIFPIHDGFIVAQTDHDFLKYCMNEAYKKKYGFKADTKTELRGESCIITIEILKAMSQLNKKFYKEAA